MVFFLHENNLYQWTQVSRNKKLPISQESLHFICEVQNQGIEAIDDSEFYILHNEIDEQSKLENQSLI